MKVMHCDFKFSLQSFSFRTQQNRKLNAIIWEVRSGLSTFPEKYTTKRNLTALQRDQHSETPPAHQPLSHFSVAGLGRTEEKVAALPPGSSAQPPARLSHPAPPNAARAQPRPALTLANGAAGGRAAPPGAYLRERGRRR